MCIDACAGGLERSPMEVTPVRRLTMLAIASILIAGCGTPARTQTTTQEPTPTATQERPPSGSQERAQTAAQECAQSKGIWRPAMEYCEPSAGGGGGY